LGGSGVLYRSRLLRLGFLRHVHALGGFLTLSLVRRGLGSLFRLGGGGLLRRGLRIADRDDPQPGHLLAVPGLAAIVVPAALLAADGLFGLRLSKDPGRDGDLAGIGQRVTLTREQDIAQHDRVTGVARQLLDRDLVSSGNAILLAAR